MLILQVDYMVDNSRLFNTLINMNFAYKALNSANDGITIVDMQHAEQPLIYVNSAFEKITGYPSNEIIGKNCRFLQGNFRDQPQLIALRKAIKNQKNCRIVLKNAKKDGSIFWNELSLAPIFEENGQLSYYVGVQKDVTKEMLQKEQIAYLSKHDVLTGLNNYRGFFSEIKALIKKGKKHCSYLAIGIADIDYFKEINDQHGHIQGNKILKLIGKQLNQQFRVHDIAARFGGDEFFFAMLTQTTNDAFFYNKISTAVTKVNAKLTEPLKITMSAGIAIEPITDKTRIENLIHQADLMMYKKKKTRTPPHQYK